jgi:hypothetical protein
MTSTRLCLIGKIAISVVGHNFHERSCRYGVGGSGRKTGYLFDADCTKLSRNGLHLFVDNWNIWM